MTIVSPGQCGATPGTLAVTARNLVLAWGKPEEFWKMEVSGGASLRLALVWLSLFSFVFFPSNTSFASRDPKHILGIASKESRVILTFQTILL